MFEEFGRDFSEEEIKCAYSVPTLKALEILGCKNVEEANSRHHRYLMEEFGKVRLYDGIEDVLKYLKQKGRVTGLVTSRNRDEITYDVCLQGIIKYFTYVICSDDTEKHKPDPEPLCKLIELAGSNISDAIYIGDTYYDYKCARDAGVDFVLAKWGASNTDNIKADYFPGHPRQLLDIVI
jgi:HAD superfamily hydrolase (TIGR01549 family)